MAIKVSVGDGSASRSEPLYGADSAIGPLDPLRSSCHRTSRCLRWALAVLAASLVGVASPAAAILLPITVTISYVDAATPHLPVYQCTPTGCVSIGSKTLDNFFEGATEGDPDFYPRVIISGDGGAEGFGGSGMRVDDTYFLDTATGWSGWTFTKLVDVGPFYTGNALNLVEVHVFEYDGGTTDDEEMDFNPSAGRARMVFQVDLFNNLWYDFEDITHTPHYGTACFAGDGQWYNEEVDLERHPGSVCLSISGPDPARNCGLVEAGESGRSLMRLGGKEYYYSPIQDLNSARNDGLQQITLQTPQEHPVFPVEGEFFAWLHFNDKMIATPATYPLNQPGCGGPGRVVLNWTTAFGNPCALLSGFIECPTFTANLYGSRCGNGMLDAGPNFPGPEQCDDGNVEVGDGCDHVCKVEQYWECSATPGQKSACVSACGNGKQDPHDYGNDVVLPELCDDGNRINGDGCSKDCRPEAGWLCNLSFPTYCNHLCGNGVREYDLAHSYVEECDDGNQTNGDGCSGSCKLEPKEINSQFFPLFANQGGCTVTTDHPTNGVTASEGVETSVTWPPTPAPGCVGNVSIKQTAATSPPPTGYWALGHLIEITAPTATAANPLQIKFTYDASLITGNPNLIRIYRNNVEVLPCAPINPTYPCVKQRNVLANGDVEITIFTVQASDWTATQAICQTCDLLAHTCTPVTPVPPECGPVRHATCYEVHEPAVNVPGVSLTDVFGPSTMTVRVAKRLCTPTDKNDEEPTAPDDPRHLTGYQIRQTTPFARVTGQRIVNQFGDATVDVIKPDYVLAPAAKSLTAPPAPLALPNDYYKCYRIRGRGPRSPHIPVKLDDQFGTLHEVVLTPRRLCAPAVTDGNVAVQPDKYLTCYKIKPAAGEPVFTGPDPVYVNDPFSSGDFRPFIPHELCVPSELNPGPTTTTTSTTSTTEAPTTTVPPVCGNGSVEGSEVCDPPMPASPYCISPAGQLSCQADCTCSAGGAFVE